MARFLCKCGNLLSNSLEPNIITFRVYSQTEWDNIVEHNWIESIKIPFPRYDVWRCPVCERIYVFEDEKLIKRYILEQQDKTEEPADC